MSQRHATRRRFLALSGSATAIGVAGCTDRLGSSSDNSNNSTGSNTSDDVNDSTNSNNESDTESDVSALEEGVPELETRYNSREQYRQPGSSLDDFEDIDDWEASQGEVEADEDVFFDGSQSLKLTSDGSENIFVERPLDDEDLTDTDLSFAIRTTTPQSITVNVRVIDYFGNSVTTSLREISYRAPDVGWFRASPGVFEQSATEPMLSDLDSIEIQVLHSMDEAEVWIDDLRTHDKPETGYVMLVWDDGFSDFYDTAAPLHDDLGFSAIQAPVPQWTDGGRDDIMSVSELQERQDEGDQIALHGTHSRLHEYEDEEEIDARLRRDKHWFIEHGFEGANYIVYPHNSFDATSLEYVTDYHYCGGFNQAGNVNTTSVYGFDPLVLPRTIGHDLDISKRCVDLAAEHNQCTILNFHAFDEENTMPEDDYEELLEHIDSADVDVITFDELWEMRTAEF